MEKFKIETEDAQMEESAEELASAVIGHRIVSAVYQKNIQGRWGGEYSHGLVLTLSNGKRVNIINSSDCCAYTGLEAFMLKPESIDHVITNVGTSNGYTTWHIYAAMNDVLKLDVAWGEGSGYYGYGFDINVIEMQGGPF